MTWLDMLLMGGLALVLIFAGTALGLIVGIAMTKGLGEDREP